MYFVNRLIKNAHCKRTNGINHPKTPMLTKEREIKPSKRKNKKLKSSGRNANKTSDSDENQALAKEKNDLLRQIDFLNSIILDTKTQFGTGLKLRPKFYEPYLIKTVKPHDRNEAEKVGQREDPHLTSTTLDFMKKWSTDDA
ncbi:hypothetical protein TNCV_3648541 [Trichonephila clavipes]|nr:hypothetical protein TNCV_3648541 [Trichonephila clavipes]